MELFTADAIKTLDLLLCCACSNRIFALMELVILEKNYTTHLDISSYNTSRSALSVKRSMWFLIVFDME
jgi:hypothetical protein